MQQWLDSLDAPKARIDEDVLEKILEVNPSLRQGRSTAEVKADLEDGQAVSFAAQQPEPQAKTSDLAKTVDFFLRAKGSSFEDAQEGFEARQKKLDEERRAFAMATRQEIEAFLNLVGRDSAEVRKVLAKHQELLGALPTHVSRRAA